MSPHMLAPPRGKVIKTLNSIRFRRHQSTARPDTATPSPDDLAFQPQKEKASTDVQVKGEAPHRVQPPVPSPRRHSPAPQAKVLFDWFHDNRPVLPQNPYNLNPWTRVADTGRFYDQLTNEIERYPDGARAAALIDDLAALCAHVTLQGCQSNP
jgi:hypothetical protein